MEPSNNGILARKKTAFINVIVKVNTSYRSAVFTT
jgi:hypothetical protein